MRFLGSILFATSVLATAASSLAQEAPDPPVWRWSLAEIRAQANKARAGRDLTPSRWPDGARAAVLLSFDIDNESENFIMGDTSIFQMTFHEYGARKGLDRVLQTLDEHQVPATFFVPAVSAMLAPDMLPKVRRSGRHEVAVHGWIHEYHSKLSKEEIRDLTTRAVEYLEKELGERPVGHRAPWGDTSDFTVDIVRELGFLYDSSQFSDDTPYELMQHGRPTGIVELPVNLNLEDSVLSVANEFSAGIMTPRDVLQVWKDSFDKAYEEGSMFLLVAHPHVVGHRSRILVIDELIKHIKSRGDVWFATHRQAAEYVKKAAGMTQ